MSFRIFISYRKSDQFAAAILLDESMRARFGNEAVFRDSRSIPLGADFRSRLWQALSESDVLLTVIGEQWLSAEQDGVRRLDMPDDYVRLEIAYALRFGLNVVPVLVGDTPLPSEGDLPRDLRELAYRQYIRIDVRTAHQSLDMLADQIARIISDQNGGTPPPPAIPQHMSGESQYTVVAIRIDKYIDRPDPEQGALRATMYEQLLLAAADASLPWSDFAVQDYLGGVHLFVPGFTSPAAIVVDYLDSLEKRLAHLPAAGRNRLRLRVAVHLGIASRDPHGWAGAALAVADRMVTAAVLADVLTARPRDRVALIVSEGLYEAVVRPGYRDVDPDSFAAVDIKTAGHPTTKAWVRNASAMKPAQRQRWPWRLTTGLGVCLGLIVPLAFVLFDGRADPRSPGGTTVQLTDNRAGTPVFSDVNGTPADAARIPFGTSVHVSCKVRNTVGGMTSVLYWYRLESEWRGLYAPSDTFANGDVPGTGGSTRVDANVPDC
ncbi:toll/interleukin-1 receptor domain-containing protein [Micromonospora sp. FIMYZ51]|uniref:toll/interleukin-1 receptor domain-containing protein n=1 Tax=Micromonospora sp. FIMYZ51 TaxID=3051832 RepID=UPI00311EC086